MEEANIGEDGGLYGPSNPAPPLIPAAIFTGDGTTAAAAAAGLRGANGFIAGAATGLLRATTAAGFMDDAAAGFGFSAAVVDANAEFSTAAARIGFFPRQCRGLCRQLGVD
ncbi:hypothetical protein OsJ_34414 [Oryza sativa Japonica Group]|uniref:Uncharacterized protein n=1 Tax=Oryza sativa subsp. japonica TaxID=39947 RepID=A3CCR2_ORYSJ|nr:hypothetical protein OsJ_34414 [Oryza sativa Japonica Group]